MEDNRGEENIRDHLANERTFLAWTRTSIGIMAFGFAIVKFSLFVKQISLGLNQEHVHPQKGYSVIIGIALVMVGSLITLLSYFRYRDVTRQIDNSNYKNRSIIITVLTAFIFVVSLALIGYLIYTT